MSWNRTSPSLLLIASLAACSGAPAEEAEDPAMVGWTAAREGDPARAAVAYREATEADPSDAESHLGLARAELRAGRPETAARAAERAIELAPESADAHELLGRARLARDEAAPAVTALARALELDPERARLHFPLARAHERAQQRDEAVAAYRASADAGVLAARALVSVARIEIDRLSPGGELTDIEGALDRAEELAGEDDVVRRAIIRERRRVEQKRDDAALRADIATRSTADVLRAGILGSMAGSWDHGSVGPFGGSGSEDEAYGGLTGGPIGDGAGLGGLGLRGIGSGGGGAGFGTIGLGTIGHGQGVEGRASITGQDGVGGTVGRGGGGVVGRSGPHVEPSAPPEAEQTPE